MQTSGRAAAVSLRPTEVFGALKHPQYRLFWAGTCVSFVGTWVQNVALGLYVYRLTGSKAALGAVGLVSGLPITLLLLYGGAIADRGDKRRILFATQSLYALSAFALAVLAATGHARVWHILGISFLNGLIFALDGPTRQSLVYDLVGPRDLATGVALQSASFNVARVVGPAIGSVVYSSFGPAWCFAANGLSFGAVLLALLFIRIPTHADSSRVDAASQGVQASLDYLRHSWQASTVLLLTATASIFGVANYQTLMPAIARDTLGIAEQDARYGFLFSAIGVGSLVAVYVVGFNARAGRRGINILAGAVGLGSALLLLSQVRAYQLALFVFFVIGLSAVCQLATANSLTQTLAPPGLRARAVSLHMLAMAGLQPFGALLAGTIGQHFGTAASLAAGGTMILLVTGVLAVRRRGVYQLQ